MSFIVFGDIHGNWNYVRNLCESKDISNMDIFSVGDFGIGFHSADFECTTLERLNQFLSERNNHLYVIRGNHDSPKYFQSDDTLLESEIRLHTIHYEAYTKSKFDVDAKSIVQRIRNLSNISFVEDYSIIQTRDNDNIFCLGGAVSIDRGIKTPGLDWWDDETINFDYDHLHNLPMGSIDYVITHTAPDFCPPIAWNDIVYKFAQRDLALHKDLPHERNNLALVYDILMKNNMIKKWFYGHFHLSWYYTQDVTDFICLNINEYYYNN